jgi:hypothetical protein
LVVDRDFSFISYAKSVTILYRLWTPAMRDRELDEAVQLGIANREVIDLAKNWCAHLEVFGSGALLAEATGLPIGLGTFGCKYAKRGSNSAMDLRFIALDFHDDNCVGCPHRQPVRLPNLSQLVGERDRLQEERQQAVERELERQAALFGERLTRRADVRRLADAPCAGIVDLIDELDREYDVLTHEKLAKLAATVPERIDAAIRSLLYDLISSGGDGRTQAALDALISVETDTRKLTNAALAALGRNEAVRVAADIVASHLDDTFADGIEAALPAIFEIASPIREPFAPQVEPRFETLDRAFAMYPARCERTIDVLLRSESERDRKIAAGCIEHLVHIDPDLGRRLALVMIGSLMLPDGEFGEIDGARRAALRALAEAFKAAPEDLDSILQKAYSNRTARAPILDVYAHVCKDPTRYRAGSVASAPTIRKAFGRLLASMTEPELDREQLFTLMCFLRDEAKAHPDILVENAEALIGTVALLIASNPDESLRYPLLQAIIRDLPEIIRVAADAAPDRLLPLLVDLFEKTPPQEDELRASLLDMLVGAAKNRRVVADILPQVYGALLDSSVRVRAGAAHAYGAIAEFGVDDLPPLLHECFINLAADRYIAVHYAFADVLTRVHPPETFQPRIVWSLGVLISGYAAAKHDARYTTRLIEAFCVQHEGELGPDEITELLTIAEALPAEEAGQSVLAMRWKLRANPGWIATAARVAAREGLSTYRRRDLLAEVMRREPAVVVAHIDALRHAVLLRVQEIPMPRLRDDEDFVDPIVEKLMRAGEWAEAVRVLAEVEALYATSTYMIRRRTLTARQKAAVEIEAAKESDVRLQRAKEWLQDDGEMKLDLDDVIRVRLNSIAAFGQGLGCGHGEFTKLAAALNAMSSDIADAEIRQEYFNLTRIIDAFAFLIRWREATRTASEDGEPYRRAAIEAAKDVAKAESHFNAAGLTDRIRSIRDLDEIPALFREALAIAIPVPFSKTVRRPLTPPIDRYPASNATKHSDVTIAFARFELENKPVSEAQVIAPNRLHDLYLEVTVSDWPATAERLVIDVLSKEPHSTYDLPTFEFSRPPGDAPFRLTGKDRLVLHVAHSLLAAPLEFTYRAYFEPESKDLQVSVEGQRRLQVYAYDPKAEPLTGHEGIDRKLFDIRGTVRRISGSDAETESFMRLMVSLGSIAWRNLFPGGKWSEKSFQSELADKLRADTRVASELEEHPHAAGGVTDLSFRRIRVELKVAGKQAVAVLNAQAYANQISQYVAGSDRRTGVICILDSSPKQTAPGIVENDVDLLLVQPPGGSGVPIALGVVIIRANLRAPSTFSR